MNIIRQDSTTTELRLEENDYLIVHTPKGTIDINVKNAWIDMGNKSSANFSITRYDPITMKPQPPIKPLTEKAIARGKN